MAGVAPRVIVALDVPSLAEARATLARLGPDADFVKIGLELFTAAGPAAVAMARDGGRDVFLDLKLHDIPNTVHGASRAAARLGARLLTIHASGGRAMIEAAVEGVVGGAGDAGGSAGSCGVLAVTVLTSLDAAALGASWGRPLVDVPSEVMRLSELARSGGAQGVVCSGAEAAAVRARFGVEVLADKAGAPSRFELLVPGIRMAGGAAHDQARVVTPAAAVRAGADYLVVGRAVTAAANPAAALAAVKAEVAGAAGRARGSAGG